MSAINLSGAFLAGILSFLSPCILPLLPAYLSFITGYSLAEPEENKSKWAVIKGTVFFGIGFSAVFVALGATATAFGRLLFDYQPVLLTVLGVVVIILGLHMLGVFRIKFLYKEKRMQVKTDKKRKYRSWQAFLVGFAFAFGWTPCISPILGGILTMAASEESVTKGIILLSVYSAGLWIPFLIAALFTAPVLAFLAKHPKVALRAEQAAGVLLVIMGILLVSGQMTDITSVLSS